MWFLENAYLRGLVGYGARIDWGALPRSMLWRGRRIAYYVPRLECPDQEGLFQNTQKNSQRTRNNFLDMFENIWKYIDMLSKSTQKDVGMDPRVWRDGLVSSFR